jgi:hypothetical protein
MRIGRESGREINIDTESAEWKQYVAESHGQYYCEKDGKTYSDELQAHYSLRAQGINTKPAIQTADDIKLDIFEGLKRGGNVRANIRTDKAPLVDPDNRFVPFDMRNHLKHEARRIAHMYHKGSTEEQLDSAVRFTDMGHKVDRTGGELLTGEVPEYRMTRDESGKRVLEKIPTAEREQIALKTGIQNKELVSSALDHLGDWFWHNERENQIAARSGVSSTVKAEDFTEDSFGMTSFLAGRSGK